MKEKGEQEYQGRHNATELEKPCDTTPKTMLMWFVHDKKINYFNHCNDVLIYLL
jgi:hypothetical protein